MIPLLLEDTNWWAIAWSVPESSNLQKDRNSWIIKLELKLATAPPLYQNHGAIHLDIAIHAIREWSDNSDAKTILIIYITGFQFPNGMKSTHKYSEKAKKILKKTIILSWRISRRITSLPLLHTTLPKIHLRFCLIPKNISFRKNVVTYWKVNHES